jgi:hypothetical protein
VEAFLVEVLGQGRPGLIKDLRKLIFELAREAVIDVYGFQLVAAQVHFLDVTPCQHVEIVLGSNDPGAHPC